MARLTWQDVAAPNFSGAMDGVESASRLINSAINQAQGGVRDYQRIQDDRLNNEFALDLLNYQDPEAYKQALTSGALFEGVDKSRLTGANISAAGSRVGSLLSQAQTEFQMGRDKRIDAQGQAFDAAAPVIAEIRQRMFNRDTAGADALAKANSGLFKGLGARDILATVDGNQNALRDGWGLARTQQEFTQDGKRFGREELDWDTQDEAARAIQEVRKNANNAESADRYITSRGFAPKVEGLIRQSLGIGNFVTYDVGDPLLDGTGAVGGQISMGAPQVAVANTLRQSGLSDAVVAGFMGNFHVEGGYTGAQGDGGTAGGIAQWRNERRANFQKIIGVDPTKASPEQQAKFVAWELNNPKSAGMTQAQADAIKNAKTPQQAAELIDKFYERSDGAARGSRIAAAGGFAQAFLGQVKDSTIRGINQADEFGSLTDGSNARTFAKTQADERPVGAIVADLKKVFPDASTGVLLDRIKSVKQQAAKNGVNGITDATAADMLARSVRGRPGFWERAFTLAPGTGSVGGLFGAMISGSGDLGSDVGVDQQSINNLINQAKPKQNRDGTVTSEVQDRASKINVNEAAAGLVKRATDAITKADQQLAQIQASGRNVDTSAIVARRNRAVEILNQATVATQPQPTQVKRQAPAWPNSVVVPQRRPQVEAPWSLRR